MAKPFYPSDRKVWVVRLGGRMHSLGPDKDEAYRQYYRLLDEQVGIGPTVKDVIEAGSGLGRNLVKR
jgi:hypothetical protein